MQTLKLLLLINVMLLGNLALGQDINTGTALANYWQIGLGLGELPMGGSFKPSITLGYYFDEKVYAGIIYQFKDEISRDGSSFNAKSSELDGLLSASEDVAQRFLLQVRYAPIKNGPYLSTGFVFNGKDQETMLFDARDRTINGTNYSGDVMIRQTRPAGWGFAVGLGYQYNFKNGFSTGFEWTPAWGQYPSANYAFGGSSSLSGETINQIENKMDEGFKSSVTNMYKVFHIGMAYRFQ